MIQLRLYTFDTKGNEIKTLFSFEPLTDRDSYDYDRESTRSATRRLRRRPFARQEVREITLAAGFLLDPDNMRNLKRMYDAHKIEWLKSINKKEVWIEYDLDVEGMMTFERVEDIDPLRRITFKLEQSEPIWFTDFENAAAVAIDK